MPAFAKATAGSLLRRLERVPEYYYNQDGVSLGRQTRAKEFVSIGK